MEQSRADPMAANTVIYPPPMRAFVQSSTKLFELQCKSMLQQIRLWTPMLTPQTGEHAKTPIASEGADSRFSAPE
jgi:hypothetical protein